MSDTPITPTEAQALIVADKQRRLNEFRQAVEALTVEYQCDLIAVPRYTQDGRTVATIEIVAR